MGLSPAPPQKTPKIEITDQLGITVDPAQTGGSKKTTVAAAAFSGPIPPPDLFASYELAFPGAADRILRMAEKQAAHRQQLEMEAIRGRLAEARMGQICALSVVFLTLCAAGFIASIGKEIAASIIGSVGVGGIVTTFVIGRRSASRQTDTPKQPDHRPRTEESTKRDS